MAGKKIIMKFLYTIAVMALLAACNSTDTTTVPNDRDRTDNDDTAYVNTDSLGLPRLTAADSAGTDSTDK